MIMTPDRVTSPSDNCFSTWQMAKLCNQLLRHAFRSMHMGVKLHTYMGIHAQVVCDKCR